ncbi:cupin domain-containing protein [Halobaculum sp. CBA1158]|uniref:cupin domain-containing protein n=1 Tax=Halobaculum sp. CBA1158 TaxID=2904243 RepID=UPI001F38AC1A|nr:cupin domain-containing protein [Halobaculum sp. CBA1158]UIO99648.1 cupin domain-containing protein [Halobaculum sp. CBA1158]
MEPVTLSEAFDSFDEPWSPRLAAELNGQAVKLARLDGSFVWHSHPDADELFWVIEGGPLDIEFREEPTATLEPGELLVVPAGVDHRPVAREPAKVALFEPAGTENTGDAGDTGDERTSDVTELATGVSRGRVGVSGDAGDDSSDHDEPR